MNQPRILVLAVNWNGRIILDKFLRCTLASDYSNFSLIIIDNNSSDGSQELIKKYTSVRLIQLQENVGWGAAINTGLATEEARSADFFLCMNNDVYLHSHALKGLMKSAANNPRLGIISPLLFEGGQLTHSGGFFTRLGWWEPKLVNQDQEEKGVTEQDLVIGAAMLIRAEVVKRIGGFDPGFFLYREDVDYCKRAKDAGFSIGVSHNASANHLGSATTGMEINEKNSLDFQSIYSQSLNRYVFKHLNTVQLLRWLITRRGINSLLGIIRNFPELISARRLGNGRIQIESR